MGSEPTFVVAIVCLFSPLLAWPAIKVPAYLSGVTASASFPQ